MTEFETFMKKKPRSFMPDKRVAFLEGDNLVFNYIILA
jgi:hypothetical protein